MDAPKKRVEPPRQNSQSVSSITRTTSLDAMTVTFHSTTTCHHELHGQSRASSTSKTRNMPSSPKPLPEQKPALMSSKVIKMDEFTYQMLLTRCIYAQREVGLDVEWSVRCEHGGTRVKNDFPGASCAATEDTFAPPSMHGKHTTPSDPIKSTLKNAHRTCNTDVERTEYFFQNTLLNSRQTRKDRRVLQRDHQISIHALFLKRSRALMMHFVEDEGIKGAVLKATGQRCQIRLQLRDTTIALASSRGMTVPEVIR